MKQEFKNIGLLQLLNFFFLFCTQFVHGKRVNEIMCLFCVVQNDYILLLNVIQPTVCCYFNGGHVRHEKINSGKPSKRPLSNIEA